MLGAFSFSNFRGLELLVLGPTSQACMGSYGVVTPADASTFERGPFSPVRIQVFAVRVSR